MNLFRIFGYFLGEATVSLWRSWKVSLLAVLTIAMSVFIGGTFLLLSSNLNRVVGEWRQEAKILVYLDDGTSSIELGRVREIVEQEAWVTAVEEITGSQASERFRETFPSVQELLESWEDEPLPASLEVSFDSSHMDKDTLDSWVERLQLDPAVITVDDDRDWLRQLDAFVAILRGLGLIVGTALLGAAVVTIASVIRLTAYLYRDEIAVMRLVGATEFYIRGPFYFEGLIQGLLGGIVAVSGLYVSFLVLNPRGSTALLGTVLVDRFLPWESVLVLLGIATLAGCLGAITSLRKETLEAE